MGRFGHAKMGEWGFLLEGKMAQSWDLARFIRTLTFFDSVPILKDIDWLKQIVLGTQPPATRPTPRLLLVAPAGWGPLPPVAGFEVAIARPDSVPALSGFAKVIAVAPTPDLVERACRELPPATVLPLFDFARADAGMRSLWGAVDDVVMGGVSESGLQLAGDRALFTGTVSTANNGGFASVRSKVLDPPLDLSDYTGIELRLKGDRQRYKFILRDEEVWDGIGYATSFDTSGEWETVRLPFDELKAVFRAKVVAGQFARERTRALQLMLSKFEYDKQLNPHFQPGNFTLEIAAISAYRQEPAVQFVAVRPSPEVRQALQESGLEWAIASGEGADAARDCARLLGK